MKTYSYSILFFIAIFILSACGAQATPTPTLVPVKPVPMATSTSAISCSAISAEPTSAPSTESYFPPVSGADFSFGPADAPVTIVEYCDFQAEGCRNMAMIIGELMRNHDDVRFIFRPLPLIDVLDKSDKAVLAALAADEQNKFWVMYDLLFVKHTEWVSLNPEAFNAWLIKEAIVLGMDGARLEAAINADETATSMRSKYDAAKKLNLPATRFGRAGHAQQVRQGPLLLRRRGYRHRLQKMKNTPG